MTEILAAGFYKTRRGDRAQVLGVVDSIYGQKLIGVWWDSDNYPRPFDWNLDGSTRVGDDDDQKELDLLPLDDRQQAL